MNVIEVKHLVKRYGNIKAVDDISFTIEKGKICGILGPNGSGKTTTIKSICNIIIPDSGTVNICGQENKKVRDKISAVFEGTRNLYWRLTPRENLRYFAGIRGLGGKKIENTINELLKRFNLTDKKNVIVNKLSRGMQQKVAIAMALACDSDIILLDEPTLGLDVESCIDIKKILREIVNEMKKTILLSSHDMNLVQDVCDDVIILNNGRIIAQDSTQNLIEMFKSKAYEIILAESVSQEDKEFLQLNYNFYFKDNSNVLETYISNSKELYEIIDILKNNQLSIKEIKQKDLNFERVYLNLIKEGKM